MQKSLPIIDRDPWLEPNRDELVARYERYQEALNVINQSAGSIVDFANGYEYFGFHYDKQLEGWWYREWLPGASAVFVFGDFNGWQRHQLPMIKEANGVWSIFLSDYIYRGGIKHKSLVKILVEGDNGTHERIPAYIHRVVQDEQTKDFVGQLWLTKPYKWKHEFDVASIKNPLIYECHIGMATEEERVGSYKEFKENILPRVKELGYNAIQIMGIAEHPYYGSFGYHVSNFFAASSRFGTPEELKDLIDTAHSMGLAVIMDIIHAHFVKNIYEGINELDGTDHLYSPAGEAGDQPYWDSKVFDFGKSEVTHFLLSNIKYWMGEFRFDGFRFDGVTSMLYHHHGYTEFDSRDKYFGEDINNPAITYLTLANKLVHELNPAAITIAEDVSGMPSMCSKIDDGGVGFDYRLAMAIPDFWIKLLKEIPDEDWDIWTMWDMMTNRLAEVGTIAYCESHDQALVGDKTIAFRLMDKDMYDKMDRTAESLVVDRGMALHKMIRLFTLTLGGNGYLNFMGNEFGHPDWIDFPREGNDWSYGYARRHWSLSTNNFLRYSFLNEFDKAMIALVKDENILDYNYAYNEGIDQENQTITYSFGDDLLFVFNWSTDKSIPDYELRTHTAGKYKMILSSEEKRFGGAERIDPEIEYFTFPRGDESFMRIYNVNRAAHVFKKVR